MKALIVAAVIAVLACQPPAPKEEAMAAPAAGTPEWKIQTAMSAAPAGISANATIMDLTANGQMTELRAGANGWLCIPDDPSTPMTDPGCFDGVWQEFFSAYMEKKPFKAKSTGLSYMLKGGQAASNTDPFKTAPDPGQDWLTGGPHLMVIAANRADLRGIPTEPGKGPWVMWAGTPYAHIMMPLN